MFIRQGGSYQQGPFNKERVRSWIEQGRVHPGMELTHQNGKQLRSARSEKFHLEAGQVEMNGVLLLKK